MIKAASDESQTTDFAASKSQLQLQLVAVARQKISIEHLWKNLKKHFRHANRQWLQCLNLKHGNRAADTSAVRKNEDGSYGMAETVPIMYMHF